MKIYFHVTKKENLEKILKEGLIPKIGEMSQDLGEKVSRIYLFKTEEDMNHALANWMGQWYEDNYGEKIELCSLMIILPDEHSIYNGEAEYEVYSYDIIKPDYIKYYRDE